MAKRKLEHDIFGRLPKEVGINSKKKDDNNERNLAKLLSNWTGEKFTRVPRSGGLDWKNNDSVYGDVVCTNRDFAFVFSVETKFYKSIALEEKLRRNSMVFKFWQQCVNDAERSGKEPILFIRKNGMAEGDYFVYLDEHFWDRYRNAKNEFEINPIVYGQANLEIGPTQIVGFKIENFFELSYESFDSFCKFAK